MTDELIKYSDIKVFKRTNNNFVSKIIKDNLINLSKLKKGYVVVKVKYSNLNFKDLLMAKGQKGLVSKIPHTPGIDMSGLVYCSRSKEFRTNDKVFVIGKPLGVEVSGSFSKFIVLHEDWVMKLPKNISLKEIMIAGTSGLTAFRAFSKVSKIIKKFSKKPILINAATSNVGLFLIYMLKKLGLNLEVVTSRPERAKKLKKLGIKKVHIFKDFNKKYEFELLSERFSVVFDNLGGDMLSLCLKYIIKNGALVSIGNILNNNSNINVLPLILREVNIIGVNAERSSLLDRKQYMNYLKKTKIISQLKKHTKIIKFEDLIKILNNRNFVKKSYRYLLKV